MRCAGSSIDTKATSVRSKATDCLAVFGHPKAHENDVRRAVAAGLDITRAVAQLSEQAERKFAVAINVRVGIHRGLVYLDTDQDDVYGFAANLTARLCGVAEPGTVAVSDSVAPLVRDSFELTRMRPLPSRASNYWSPITRCSLSDWKHRAAVATPDRA